MERKNPLLVAFSTQKGGIGKSALTVLMSGYFHYRYNRLDRPINCKIATFVAWS